MKIISFMQKPALTNDWSFRRGKRVVEIGIMSKKKKKAVTNETKIRQTQNDERTNS